MSITALTNIKPIFLICSFLLLFFFFIDIFCSYLRWQNENNGLSLFCGILAIIVYVDIFYVNRELNIYILVLF